MNFVKCLFICHGNKNNFLYYVVCVTSSNRADKTYSNNAPKTGSSPVTIQDLTIQHNTDSSTSETKKYFVEMSSMSQNDDVVTSSTLTSKTLSPIDQLSRSKKKTKSSIFLEEKGVSTVEKLGYMSNEEYAEIIRLCHPLLQRHVNYLRCLARLFVLDNSCLSVICQIPMAIGATPIVDLQVVESYLVPGKSDKQSKNLGETFIKK